MKYLIYRFLLILILGSLAVICIGFLGPMLVSSRDWNLVGCGVLSTLAGFTCVGIGFWQSFQLVVAIRRHLKAKGGV